MAQTCGWTNDPCSESAGSTGSVLAVTNSSSGDGIYGQSSTGNGVDGHGSVGVFGFGGTYGVEGESTGGDGVHAYTTYVSGYGVYGGNTGGGVGIYGTTNSTSGSNAIEGHMTGGSGYGNGIAGYCNSSGASGVYGNTTASGYGVAGRSSSTSATGGAGIYGESNAANVNAIIGSALSTASGGTAAGVYGSSSAPYGYGLYGVSTGTSGWGVYGIGNTTSTTGVLAAGKGTASTNPALGVFGYASVSGHLTLAGNCFGLATCDQGHLLWLGSDDALKPNGGSWTSTSDLRLKKNVATLTDSLQQLLKLRGVSFEWKDPAKVGSQPGRQIGMIAQEVEQVFPEWVRTDRDGYKTLTFHGFEALTVESMRELKAENDRLATQLADLRGRLERIEGQRADANSPVPRTAWPWLAFGIAGPAVGYVLSWRRRGQ